jgi:DNA-binding beta-propeller fold protein YncE
MKQTLYSGLAFSRDGSHIYASMGSLTDPLGTGKDDTGSGIVVYRFAAGKIQPERMIRLPLEKLAPGRITRLLGEKDGDQGVPFPAAIEVVGAVGAEKLLVAENYSDDVLLLDAASGAIEHRFDLAENDAVPSTYPGAIELSQDGRRAFIALWNASEIVELDLTKNEVGRKLALLKPADPVAASTHPCAFALAPDGKTLYVALANRDSVAAVNVGGGQFAVKGYFDTRLPGQSYFGAEPLAVALNGDGSRLYVADMASDAVAVIDPRKLTAKAGREGMVEPMDLCPPSGCRFHWRFCHRTPAGSFTLRPEKGREPARTIWRSRLRRVPRASICGGHRRISGRCCMGRWVRSMQRRSRRICRGGRRRCSSRIA